MNTNPEAPGASAGARRHDLKIDEKWIDRIVDGSKTAEVRKHDRDFQIGDTVTFCAGVDYDDWRCEPRAYRYVDAEISHVLPASVFPEGICAGYSVLSLTNVGNERTRTRAELQAEWEARCAEQEADR